MEIFSYSAVIQNLGILGYIQILDLDYLSKCPNFNTVQTKKGT